MVHQEDPLLTALFLLHHLHHLERNAASRLGILWAFEVEQVVVRLDEPTAAPLAQVPALLVEPAVLFDRVIREEDLAVVVLIAVGRRLVHRPAHSGEGGGGQHNTAQHAGCVPAGCLVPLAVPVSSRLLGQLVDRELQRPIVRQESLL